MSLCLDVAALLTRLRLAALALLEAVMLARGWAAQNIAPSSSPKLPSGSRLVLQCSPTAGAPPEG